MASSSNGASVTSLIRPFRRVTARLAGSKPPAASVPHSPSSRPNTDSTTRCGRSWMTWTAARRAVPSGNDSQVRSPAGVSPFTIATSATTLNAGASVTK